MIRVQILKAVTACVVLAIPQASNAQSAPGSTVHDSVAVEMPLRSQEAAAGADRSTPRHAARDYLDQAKAILDAVPQGNLDHHARKLLTDLRHEFSALSASYVAHEVDRKEAQATSDVAGAGDWQARFSDVERRLAEIVGAGSSYSPSYVAAGTLAGAVAGAAPAPAAQRKAASSPATATLVAPVTSPRTTVVTPVAPAGDVSSAPSAAPTVAAQPAGTTTPPPATVSPQSPAPAITPPGTPPVPGATDAGTGLTPASTTGAGTGSAATAGALPSPAGTVAGNTATGAAAVAGVLISTIGLKNLDPAVRMQLEEFRISVELFFDATTVKVVTRQ